MNRCVNYLTKFYLLCVLILLVLCHSSSALAVNQQSLAEALNIIQRQTANLQKENQIYQNKLTYLNKQLALLPTWSPETVNSTLLKQAKVNLNNTRLSLSGIELELVESKQAMVVAEERIKDLTERMRDVQLAPQKKLTATANTTELQMQLSYQQALIKLIFKQNRALLTTQKLLLELQQLENQVLQELTNLWQAHQTIKKERILHQYELKLQTQQDFWLEQRDQLHQKLANLGSEPQVKQRIDLQLRLFVAQEMSKLLSLQLTLAYIDYRLTSQVNNKFIIRTVTSLNQANLATQSALQELINTQSYIDSTIKLVKQQSQHLAVIKKNNNISVASYDYTKQHIRQILHGYQQQLLKITGLSNKIKNQRSMIQKYLTKELARRQGLPGFDLQAWKVLANKLIEMSILLKQAIINLQQSIMQGVKLTNVAALCGLGFIIVTWFWACIMMYRYLCSTKQRYVAENKNFTSDLLAFIGELLRRSVVTLTIFLALFFSCLYLNVPFKAYSPFFALALVWFGFAVILDIASMTLYENTTDHAGRDARLFRGLKLALWLGGSLTALTVLSHQLPVAYELIDFFNRLFMVFMLALSILLLSGWQIVPTLLKPYLDNRRHSYLWRTIRVLSFLIPITLLSNAIIGLLGYVDFAITLGRYEAQFLFVLALYLLFRGLLRDGMDALSQLFIRRIRNGWLWTQAALRPLDRVLQFILLLLAIYALFAIYGWLQNPYILQKIHNWEEYPILSPLGIQVTTLNLMFFLIFSAVLIWAVSWSREFAYRWLFSETKDLGLRNSLAVFSQYAIALIGLIIALKLLGIDFKGLALVLSAFAVGIGFGLRDLANNFVSGILLLIERPVRKGDLITLDKYQGEVLHIGMRSLVIQTWDHMEVLIPNSDIFSKSFTNWTYKDSIVRTVIEIKINRVDEPERVKDLVWQLLSGMPEIESEPEPQIYLHNIDEALIVMQVRYYINLQQQRSRAKLRSKVLFALNKCLREHSISPPYPSQDIYVKSLPS